jgi:hypothetical protein
MKWPLPSVEPVFLMTVRHSRTLHDLMQDKSDFPTQGLNIDNFC